MSADRPSPPTLKFNPSVGFHKELKSRIERYFEERKLTKRDLWPMYLKTAVILTWLAASYGILVFVAIPWWGALLAAVSLGLAVAAVGFNIQHDGNHQAYSENPRINRLMALTLDMLGGSSYLWDWKHNRFHHTYSNITGHDDDIELGVFGRLSPHQPRLSFHRFQHIYLWFLYGFLSIKWQLFDDFNNVAKARIGDHKIPRPRGLELFLFVVGKVFFFSFAFVVPMLFHPVLHVLLFFFIASYVNGFVLSVVFQLAHAVEGAEFPLPDDHDRIDDEFFVHQLETTVDFARDNKLLNWYVGGLNFQVEHHLFPRICHLHYPELSRIVEDTCKEWGITYNAHKSLISSLASHYRWLYQMGREDQKPMEEHSGSAAA